MNTQDANELRKLLQAAIDDARRLPRAIADRFTDALRAVDHLEEPDQ